MKLTNQQIYNYAEALITSFKDCNTVLPVRINFFLQKNINTIRVAALEIEQARKNIIVRFGTPKGGGAEYDFTPAALQEANRELKDLFSLEQNLNIHLFEPEELDGFELTYQQMSAIMFMIGGNGDG